jgi:hypothetical protein
MQVGVFGIVANAGTSAGEGLTVNVDPRIARRVLRFAGDVCAVAMLSK